MQSADSSTYTVGPLGDPLTEDLDDDAAGDEVVVDTAATITFKADGSASLPAVLLGDVHCQRQSTALRPTT